MNFISLNLSYVILVGISILFSVSVWQAKNATHPFLKILILFVPVALAFYFLVVKELPNLWIALPLYLVAIILGQLFKNKRHSFLGFSGLLMVTALICLTYIPDAIAENLSESLNEPAQQFELQDLLSSEKINNNSVINKVVVLDFFGTWCAPCIREMQELKQIKSSLSNYENELEFIIVCTDTGGDTPHKAKSFHKKRELPFRLAFDYQSKHHKKFNFSGVPALIVIDKKGNIRFSHEGYNQAEDLSSTLRTLLIELLNE
ncbi:hypothetical protein SB49_15715 [Sediminicola sp. YIK13]|nr:hypothetical protein SB49_15715 [Sediminicola sp. YIK13]